MDNELKRYDRMKQIFLKQEHHECLFLFFAGWGSDEHLFARPTFPDCDYMLCFDYRNLDFDYSLLEDYREIRLLAWSMGVWVAGKIFEGRTYPWGGRLAVNGTLSPIDDRLGIPEAIFRGTLDNFSPSVLTRFRRRICGSVQGVKLFLDHAPYRTVDSLHQELAYLYEIVQENEVPSFHWDKALVGSEDKIFPAVAQQNAWDKVPVQVLPVEHYDEDLFDRLLAGEEDLWINR